jgi:predicted lipid-binding transport protein (Tim44 family)
MDGNFDLLTIIALVVAVIVVLRLRSVLGRRTGDEETRIERYRQQRRQSEARAQPPGKVVTLPRRDREEPAPREVSSVAAAETEAKIKAFAAGDENVARGLAQLVEQDSRFDPEQFICGAKKAYEMIVTAFAEGNRKTLQELLAPEVYESFAAEINEREARGEQIDQSFVGIGKAEIVEADVSGDSIASLTVRFVSQLIKAVRDRSGAVIDGDEHRVIEVTDIWTFSRDVSSERARSNLNWRLAAT